MNIRKIMCARESNFFNVAMLALMLAILVQSHIANAQTVSKAKTQPQWGNTSSAASSMQQLPATMTRLPNSDNASLSALPPNGAQNMTVVPQNTSSNLQNNRAEMAHGMPTHAPISTPDSTKQNQGIRIRSSDLPDKSKQALGQLKTMQITLSKPVPPKDNALKNANQLLLTEAHGTENQVMPVATSASRGTHRSYEVSTSNRTLGEQTSTTCLNPGYIEQPKGTLTPGGMIYVRGCELGKAKGELRMFGAFSGGSVKLDIVEWTNQLVIALVPDQIREVNDQEAKIKLITHAGQSSQEKIMPFLAKRETVELPETLITNTQCARPQPSDCSFQNLLNARWAFGFHRGSDSQQGSDEWRLTMGKNWQLERIDSYMNGALTDVQPFNNMGRIVRVNWRSVAIENSIYGVNFNANYYMRFFVTGPAGVPFTDGIN